MSRISSLWLTHLQECQRLETILNLCTELGHVAREPAAVSDLQKINKELEKLQVSDDESVFSESPGSTAAESCFGIKSRDFNVAEEQQVSQRQHSGYREMRSHSPAVSLNSSAPSPSANHRPKVSHTTIIIPKIIIIICWLSGKYHCLHLQQHFYYGWYYLHPIKTRVKQIIPSWFHWAAYISALFFSTYCFESPLKEDDAFICFFSLNVGHKACDCISEREDQAVAVTNGTSHMWKAAHQTADGMWGLGCLANNIKRDLCNSLVSVSLLNLLWMYVKSFHSVASSISVVLTGFKLSLHMLRNPDRNCSAAVFTVSTHKCLHKHKQEIHFFKTPEWLHFEKMMSDSIFFVFDFILPLLFLAYCQFLRLLP